jgi:uncharacterized protein YvpB
VTNAITKIFVSVVAVAGFLLPAQALAAPAPTLKYSVPFHRQEHALSCEAASLKMALDGKGIGVFESDILAKTPFGPMWGDPDLYFTGNIDGRQFVDGYGIHWDAIAHVARNYTPAESFHRVDLHYLIDRLHDNGPVVIWGSFYRSPAPASWTYNGKYIHAVRGEHTFVVTGYAGDRRAPTYIYLMDSLYGERILRTGDFLRNWGYYNNSGVFLK